MIRILILITLFPLITPFFTYEPVIAIQKRHEIPKDRPVFLFIYYNHCGRSAMTAPAIQKAAKILKKRGIETLSLEYEQTMFEYYKIDPNLHKFPGIYTYAKDGTRSKFPGYPIYVEPEEFVRFVDRNQRHAIDNPMPPVPRRWDDSEEQSQTNRNTNTTTATTTRTTITPAATSKSAAKVISTSAPKTTLSLSTTKRVLPITSSSSPTTVDVNMSVTSISKPAQSSKGAKSSSTSPSPSITMKATTSRKTSQVSRADNSGSTTSLRSATTTIASQAPQIRSSKVQVNAKNSTWRKAKVASWQLKQNKRRPTLRRPTAMRLRRPISVKKQVLNKANTRDRRPLLRKNMRQNSRKLRRPVLTKTKFTSGVTTAASTSLDSTITTTTTKAATTTMTADTISTTATKPPQTSLNTFINLPVTTQTTEWPLSTNQFTNFVTPASPSFNQNLNTKPTTRKWKLIEIVQLN